MKLNKTYFYNGRQYGPGEAEVPTEIVGLISGAGDLSSHTVAELKDMAREKGIEGFSSMNKAELIEALSD